MQSALGLMQSSPMPMLLWWGEEALPCAANPAFYQLLGDPERPMTEAAWDAEDWAQVQADVARVRETGEVVWRENLHVPLPNTHSCEFRGTYSYNPLLEGGRVAGVLFMCTRHYRASSVQSDGRYGYAAVIHAMDMGFAIVEALDTPPGQWLDYLFIEVNGAWVKQTGFEAIQGKRATELLNEREPFWPQTIERVLRTGSSERAITYCKNLKRTMDVFSMRLGGPGSRQVALLVRDISAEASTLQALQRSEQRARAEAARAEAERGRLNAVVQTIPAPVFVVNMDGEFVQANSRAREEWGSHLQADRHKWMGWWADGSVHHGQRLSPGDWPLARALRGEVSEGIIEIARPNDARERRIYQVSGAPIYSQEQELEGAVVTATDITDRVRAEQALQEAHQRKDEFLAMLAHELRNPLAPIGSAAELMSRPNAGKDLMLRTSAIIARQVRHMTGLVDDLLDMSRVNRGTITLDKEFLDSTSVLNDAIEQVTPMLRAKRHRLDVEPPAQPVLFEGDRKRVIQVLSNLLNNAIKYTPDGGRIQLGMEQVQEQVEIRVRDNGLGMDSDTLASAFDLFAQARRTSDRQQGGLGIGLALVKKLVELHGGQVSASSPGLGQGSEFVVRLPSCRDMPSAPGPTDPGEHRPAGPLQVLVVDDHVDGAMTLAMLIETEGHSCHVLHDPLQALDWASRQPPEVCVLDIGLPGMDGRELARRLRAQPGTEAALLIALSGYAQPKDQEAAMAAGFDHYLVKPVDSTHLLQLLADRARPQHRQPPLSSQEPAAPPSRAPGHAAAPASRAHEKSPVG